MTEPAPVEPPPVTGGLTAHKAIVQLLTAIAVAVLPLVTAGPLSPAEWVNAVLVAMGAGAVYIAENQPAGTIWHYTKTIMASIAAGGVIAVSALSDGSIVSTEWYQIIAAIAGAIATYVVPNDGPSPGGRHRAPEEEV